MFEFTRRETLLIRLATYLADLDHMLTDHYVSDQVHHKDLVHFLNGEMRYLSDGGYSRVFMRYDAGEAQLELTSNSTGEAHHRWDTPDVRLQRRRVEELVTTLFALRRKEDLVTDWDRLREYLAESPEDLPYLFGSLKRMNPKWFELFKTQARAYGLTVTVEDGQVYLSRVITLTP